MTCLVKFLLMFSCHRASHREIFYCFSKKVFTAVASKKQQTSLQSYRAIFPFSHTVEREMPILPRLSPHTFSCSTVASPQVLLPALVRSSPGATGDICSGIWECRLPSFCSHLCVLRALSHKFFLYSMHHFTLSHRYFPRGATSLAAGLSCVLQGVCCRAGQNWPCLARGSSGVFPQMSPLALPAPGHRHSA